jgi:hypothetical protein
MHVHANYTVNSDYHSIPTNMINTTNDEIITCINSEGYSKSFDKIITAL